MSEQSATEQLVGTIIAFPKYAFGWVVGLVIAVLSDLHITTLAITGVLGGFVFGSALIGVFLFFVAYTISRVLSNIADGSVYAGNQVARALVSRVEYEDLKEQS